MTPTEILQHCGVKPTANRLLVVKALQQNSTPQSLIELETYLETLERSSISRVLLLLLEHGAVHAMQDGRGVTKYELCSSHNHCSTDDMHVHFFCEKCNKVICFQDLSIPTIQTPKGYIVNSVNYMLKGICPECGAKDL